MSLQRTIQWVFASAGLCLLAVGGSAVVTLWSVRGSIVPALPASSPVPPLFDRGLWLVGGATVLGLVGLGAGGAWLLSSLRRSLTPLRTAVEHVRTGRLDATVAVDTADELGRLARALSRTTTTLSQRTVSRTYLHAVLDSMAELLFVVEADGQVRHANQAAAEALGQSASSLRGTPLARHFDEDPLAAPDDSAAECTLAPSDGDRPSRPVLISRSTLSGAGAPDGTLVCVAQDISDRKAAEDKLRRSLDEKEVLLREIHHRVKNNLQVISSLLHAQARDTNDDAVAARFQETRERIRSMAAIHEQLYQTDDVSQVDFDAYLEGLVDELFRSHRTRSLERELQVDAATLPIDQAIPAGLIVNELVSNALEHAFPDGGPGTVAVHFHTTPSDATLHVEDDGQGTDALEGSSSLGLRLVRGLTRQLRGTLASHTDDGVAITITFPLSPST